MCVEERLPGNLAWKQAPVKVKYYSRTCCPKCRNMLDTETKRRFIYLLSIYTYHCVCTYAMAPLAGPWRHLQGNFFLAGPGAWRRRKSTAFFGHETCCSLFFLCPFSHSSSHTQSHFHSHSIHSHRHCCCTLTFYLLTVPPLHSTPLTVYLSLGSFP